ncbi:hypothetical protein O0L34_g9047 [Tuta absoluta]|nr:hypothetical protein O0L34_g9047 [Tuta absoluta]
MHLFNGFRFSFNLSSRNDKKLEFSENNASEVYITGAYKPFEEEFLRSESYGEAPKKLNSSMVKLPPSFQPDPTAPGVIQASKSTGDLRQQTQLQKLQPELRKSTPAVSTDPRGAESRQLTESRNTNNAAPKDNQKEQIKWNKKQIAEQKKQDKLQAQQRAKEEKLRNDREKAEIKERAKQEKLRVQREKAEAAKSKKEANKNKNNAPKTRTNPLAQGPNAPLPYTSNTLQSSISKSSGPPPYEANNSSSEPKNPALRAKNPALQARNPALQANNPALQANNPGLQANNPGLQAKNPAESSNVSRTSGEQMSKDSNVSYAPPTEASTWDMVAAHRVQVSRAPVGGAANKVAIRLQEPQDDDVTATTGRKSLYV